MGWKNRVVPRSTGEKVNLETMKGDDEGAEPYWIIPRKMNIDGMQQVFNGLETVMEEVPEEPDQIEGKKARAKVIKKALFNQDQVKMMKASFLYGVADHNFDDDEGNKVTWDENFFEELKAHPEVLLEIYRVVMEFCSPLLRVKSGKSVT